jgi:hypothetical protein
MLEARPKAKFFYNNAPHEPKKMFVGTFVGFVGTPLIYFSILFYVIGENTRRGVTIKTYKRSSDEFGFKEYLTVGRPPLRISVSISQPYSTNASIAACA